MDEILAANFMLFHDIVLEQRYDLWIGDEAWELDYYLHENPREKRVPFAWLTDFVGFLPMADGQERERFLTADYKQGDLSEWREALNAAGHPTRALDFIIPGDLAGREHGARDRRSGACECGTSLRMLTDHYAYAIEDLRRNGPRPADTEWPERQPQGSRSSTLSAMSWKSLML